MKKSTLFKGLLVAATLGVAVLCPIAGAVAGAIWAGSTAATTGGMIGLGILGWIGGGIVGGVAGQIVSAPARIYLAAKTGKFAKKSAPELLAALESKSSSLGGIKITSSFNSTTTTNDNKAEAPAAKKAPAKVYRLG